MLPLQLKRSKLPRKTIFLSKLLLFCASMHLIFFLLLAMVQSWRLADIVRLHDISDGASVVLVPLIKTISPHMQASVSTIQKKASTEKKDTAKKAPFEQITKMVKEVPTAKPVQPQKKEIPQKKSPPPMTQQKPVKKEIKKNEPVAQTDPVQKMPSMVDTATTTTTVQQVGHYDLALITLCNEIKVGIAKEWRRPTNIPSTEQCHVKVCVRSETERTATIVKSSHALALDIMVKNFVARYPFPRALWHTEIELIF